MSQKQLIQKSLEEIDKQIILYHDKCRALNFSTHKETWNYCADRMRYWYKLKTEIINHAKENNILH